jgi:hypothetical protein
MSRRLPLVLASAGERLSAHVEAFAAGLSDRERAILGAAAERAMDPLDRIRRKDPGEVLDEEELRLLAELLARGEGQVAR